jgi:uncharacterized protein with HEPN domain
MESAKLPEIRLGHILDEIDAISSATQAMTANAVTQDYLALRAVERAIQIISEAAKELPAEIREQEPDVPWPAIIRIENLLRHEYYRIDASVIQAVLTEHLPHLRPAIVRLLQRYQD